MDLKSLIVEDTSIEVEHPLLEGLKVKVNYITKEKMKRLLDKSRTMKFSKKTHKLEESLDDDIFLEAYSEALIKDWSGFKLKYLKELLPVNLKGADPESLLEYKPDNALDLLKGSSDFDSWLSNAISDVSVFNKTS